MGRVHVLAILVAAVLAGCSGAAQGSASVDAASAVRLVLAQDDRFTGIGPRDDDLIGQPSWYEVTQADAGWQVTVRIGWGDCPSGCIRERRWTYRVDESGGVRLMAESGDALPAPSSIGGTVTAGPTCPVVSVSPDPSCVDRPVAGAVLVVLQAGTEVARVSSATDGSFQIDLAPGVYRLVPRPVEGLMGTPAPIDVRVEAGESVEGIALTYDTGIR